MKLKEFISKPFSAISEWCKAHERFIAVKLTRILAVGFIIVSFIFLLKSLGLL